MSTIVETGPTPTNLGLLTTTFTSPAGRAVVTGASGSEGRKDVAILSQSCTHDKPVDATTCWPSALKIFEQSTPPQGYYSPGLQCPVGYWSACSATGGSTRCADFLVQSRLNDGETAVGCCPSSYTCANINGQTCTMVATAAAIPTVTCDGSKSGAIVFQTVPNPKASFTATSLLTTMIQIHWHRSDRNTIVKAHEPDATIDITNTVEATIKPLELDARLLSARTGVVVPESVIDDGSPHSHGPLSSAFKVGMGVSGAVIVLMVVVCTMFWCWRRCKLQQEEQELDRLYGVITKVPPSGELADKRDVAGWHQGRRPHLLSPTRDPYRENTIEFERPMPSYQRAYWQ